MWFYDGALAGGEMAQCLRAHVVPCSRVHTFNASTLKEEAGASLRVQTNKQTNNSTSCCYRESEFGSHVVFFTTAYNSRSRGFRALFCPCMYHPPCFARIHTTLPAHRDR